MTVVVASVMTASVVGRERGWGGFLAGLKAGTNWAM